jgi:hypothetical protein
VLLPRGDRQPAGCFRCAKWSSRRSACLVSGRSDCLRGALREAPPPAPAHRVRPYRRPGPRARPTRNRNVPRCSLSASRRCALARG